MEHDEEQNTQEIENTQNPCEPGPCTGRESVFEPDGGLSQEEAAEGGVSAQQDSVQQDSAPSAPDVEYAEAVRSGNMDRDHE